MPLKAFDENGICPKCGARDISMQYCNDQHAASEYSSEVAIEHMHRQCARCGYPWIEACLDAASAEASAAPQ
ncbi:MAG: hypothetical protein ABIO92_11065 [Chloroflexia bacterium]